MTLNRNTIGSTLRVSLALCVLLFGCLTEPVKWLVAQPVTCGMACCEASGVCYCQMEHADEPEISGDAVSTDSVRFDTASIDSSCPVRCAQVPAGFQKHSPAKVNPTPLAFVIKFARDICIRAPHRALSVLIAEAHSPRAPPHSVSFCANNSLSISICL